MSNPSRFVGFAGNHRSVPSRFLLVFLTILLLADTVDGGTLVRFRTALGSIDVELLDKEKPETVKNFLRYLESGFYRNTFLHRCVPGFIVQGGGYFTTNRLETNLFTVNKLFVYPKFPPVTNEFSVGPRISNTYGTLAMARTSGGTNSATSQWFFNTADNPHLDNLDGGFTVFGIVRRGTNVLEVLNSLSYNLGLINMGQYTTDPILSALFGELPVLYLGGFYPRLNDLFYVDISLVSVSIRSGPGGERIISWNSVENRPNSVEYSDQFPPVWQRLLTTNGNGSIMEVPDASLIQPQRFYRVTIDY